MDYTVEDETPENEVMATIRVGRSHHIATDGEHDTYSCEHKAGGDGAIERDDWSGSWSALSTRWHRKLCAGEARLLYIGLVRRTLRILCTTRALFLKRLEDITTFRTVHPDTFFAIILSIIARYL